MRQCDIVGKQVWDVEILETVKQLGLHTMGKDEYINVNGKDCLRKYYGHAKRHSIMMVTYISSNQGIVQHI